MTCESEVHDLLIVGGGVNGCGIARDAAGRGLRVLLCEQDDLAGNTTSRSTKLIHGGLRYLESYRFRMVREALSERETLLGIAPHIVWPLRFVLPHNRYLRPAWMIRMGLFLYDNLGGRKRLAGSRGVDLRKHVSGRALRDEFVKGFIYSDCAVLDSRLAVLNAMDAADRGATILTRTRCESARRVSGLWQVRLRDLASGRLRELRARSLINAAGPWVNRFIERGLGLETRYRIRLVKGSHILVPRLFDHDYAYIFQNSDRRIVFAIPYEQEFTLIGTTDLEYRGDPGEVEISQQEIDYLCDAVNDYFKKQISPSHVVSSFSGVRPLFDDASSNASTISREYVLDLEAESGEAPLLNIYGGKLTAYRQVAERALAKLLPLLNSSTPPWTASVPLPGGDVRNNDLESLIGEIKGNCPWLPQPLVKRYARYYGTRCWRFLNPAGSLQEMGHYFGGSLYEAEVRYLVEYEWARTAEDILWRRTRLGLSVPEGTARKLDAWLSDYFARRERDVVAS